MAIVLVVKSDLGLDDKAKDTPLVVPSPMAVPPLLTAQPPQPESPHDQLMMEKYLFECAHPRSGKWPAVREAHLKEHPECEVCGRTDHVQVHHEHPYHLFPQDELDPRYLHTLCEAAGCEHHLNPGHTLDGKSGWAIYNTHLEVDVANMRAELEQRRAA
jgi:hypothetical protein